MIALIDYGAGNLTSVRKGLAAAGAEFYTPSAPAELVQADALVIPGVGHFAATAALTPPWRDAIRETLGRGTPLLGICLGLQWLFEGSAEAPDVPGLGIVAGTCTRLAAGRPLKIPHVGWNGLHVRVDTPLLNGVADGSHVYFTHSFAAPVTPECAATTTHGEPFAAVIGTRNIFGVQFHPEKSGDAGLRMLRNFVTITRSLRHAV